MPMALTSPAASRMILRPEPPSCPCTGCIRSTGEGKCCSKRFFRRSIFEDPSNVTARFRITIQRPIHHKDIIEAHDTTEPTSPVKTLVFQEREQIRRG